MFNNTFNNVFNNIIYMSGLYIIYYILNIFNKEEVPKLVRDNVRAWDVME